jgi:hypothetical protein
MKDLKMQSSALIEGDDRFLEGQMMGRLKFEVAREPAFRSAEGMVLTSADALRNCEPSEYPACSHCID